MFGEDEETLQDFLIEGGEILEQLSEQLIQLEQQPDDKALLNAIFRGFHTVKGGAGFLQLNTLVDCCHIIENLFDNLRHGHCVVTSELIDVVLKALDALNKMFQQLQRGERPDAADPALLASLTTGFKNQKTASAITAEVDMADAEFEQFLRAITGTGAPQVATQVTTMTANSNNDAITDDEFEALLNDLHGDAAPGSTKATEFSSASKSAANIAVVADADSEMIDDDEFEALLDQLHGKGRGPTTATTSAPSPTKPRVNAIEKKSTTAKQVAAVKDGAIETTVRVETRRLDDIMNMVGELVLVRNRLVRSGTNNSDKAMINTLSSLDAVIADLQTAVMKARMQPIKKIFGRFPRVVRDLARNLNKDIVLELEGEETDLDKNLVEALADPLVHLVRNSVDHGIEIPAVRERFGKSRVGKIILAAKQEGDHILLSITDDGSGMDPHMLREKAVKKGLFDKDAAARLSDSECFDIIFIPGFSTKTEITDVSGRGVGMDVVKTRVSELNGSIDITSSLGKGTRIAIKVPLALAIMPALMVKLDDQAFAFPLMSVNETFQIDPARIKTDDGQAVITVRGKQLPLFYLKQWLVEGSYATEMADSGHVVIVTVGSRRVGLVVDQLMGEEDIVIKPLGKLLQGTPGMAGATITSEGRIALILDIPSMLKRFTHDSG